jgi:hypothetical protein
MYLIQLNPDFLIYTGVIGLFAGILVFIFFLYRRISWLIRLFSKKKAGSPKLMSALRNLILILLWTAVFGMALFMGFFLQAYHAFTFERPVAELIIQPLEENKTSRITLAQFHDSDSRIKGQYVIKGDQWMLEGDILKWDSWLNFLGLHTRYRLTRLRGRYLKTEDEVQNQATIYSLVEKEDNTLWQYLYRYGQKFPFVSTVYGNAAFQNTDSARRFSIYVGASGFVVREIKME